MRQNQRKDKLSDTVTPSSLYVPLLAFIFALISTYNIIRISMSLSSSTVGGKIKFKIVLLGDQHVGKTSIIERFINDRFENNYDVSQTIM
jgi:GTPase SAR1 family protein